MKLKLICGTALLVCSVGSAIATPIIAGPNTVILDNFNGSTTGVAYGGLSYAASQSGYGQAAQFGPSNFIQYTLGSLSQGTIELWVKPDVAPSVTPDSLLTINWFNTNSMPGSGYILHMGLNGPGGTVQTSAWPGGGAVGTTPLTSGSVWTHIAASWGAAGTKVYVNGVLDGFSPAPMNISFLPVNYLYLNYWGNSNFTGLMDELQISNIQLSDAIIAQHAALVDLPNTGWLLGIGLLGMLSRLNKTQKNETTS